MGLFNLFSKKDGASGQDRELARLQKMITNKLSQNLDRRDALDRLAAMGTSEAVKILLTRFTWNLDPSITDQEEKELAVQGIARAGKNALAPIRAFCRKAESVTWPLKALRQIVSPEELVDELVALLNQFDTDYQRNPEPKIQILQALEEFPSESAREAVEQFLTDSSESVRFAAVSTLFRIGRVESTPAFVRAIGEDESLRIKNRIAVGLVERGWEIPTEQLEVCGRALPPGFRLEGARISGSQQRV